VDSMGFLSVSLQKHCLRLISLAPSSNGDPKPSLFFFVYVGILVRFQPSYVSRPRYLASYNMQIASLPAPLLAFFAPVSAISNNLPSDLLLV